MFAGHISGWVQTLLFVFMFGVQISLLCQEFFTVGTAASFVKPTFTTSTSTLTTLRCADDGYKFIYSLAYVMILLIMQVGHYVEL